ncbi:LOW QUALITY PROTEIN: hypothetical protein PHMEG_0001479 [Phytophthora megakarya]|uniref:Reverse transcriptase n=1 Tax=Phytophthora megakarya TaxID=4795 RepID=A0A225X2Q7_9STRA|nr:LOW QUALITY PROTEIN: hypothetical protein PHMEG_0001479 [Phytophthora megakarya]
MHCPPPAYGVVGDIDVQGHPPIKQKTRRTPLRYLSKMYELLKGLLLAGLITLSHCPWASTIVIVLKKNGVDIHLCIDCKMVNAVTDIMEYAMPLVDDLLTDVEGYLWFCLLDAASRFCAIMMSSRARKVSAFMCALVHFEWLRMPFVLKKASMIYQQMIDNALRGFVQVGLTMPSSSEERIRTRQERGTETIMAHGKPNVRSKFEADREAAAIMDPVSLLINRPTADMFKVGEVD